MNTSEVLSLIASVFTFLSVASYFKQLVKGESIPNPATWLIWLAVTLLNTLTYFKVVEGNIWTSLVSIVLTIGFCVVFIYASINGKFAKLERLEIISLVLAVLIGIFWQTTGNAIIANLLIQVIFLISFYPTIVGLLRRKLKEKALPWIFAVISCSILITSVIMNWEQGGWVALAFPIIRMIGNGSVAIIVWGQNEKNLNK